MLISKQEKEYKAILRMEKRRDEINEILRDAPYYPLDKPVQDGWEVYIELIPEIKRRDNAFDIQQVLDIGFNDGYRISKLEYVKMIRAGITGYSYKDNRGRSHYHDFRPSRAKINDKEYELLTPALKKYFTFDTSLESDKYYIRTGRRIYRLSHDKFPEYWTRLKVRPYFLTHYRSKGGKLEKEEAYLEEKIDEYYRVNRGNGTSYNSWMKASKNKERTSQRTQIRKFLKGEADDIVSKHIRHY